MSARADPARATRRRRVSARVHGTVQGVGFRPFVYRVARELGIEGFVLNDDRGVLIEAEADGELIEQLLRRVVSDAPPLAVIERIEVRDLALVGDGSFAIRPSVAGRTADAPVTPDTATCEDCLRELLDPADRRHRYPFINCTNCGPRFTIVRGVPYDRPFTTMAGFQMCEECRREYEDPADRRFHAQPNACARCGPSAALLDGRGNPVTPGLSCDPVQAAAAALAAGQIVAVKGIGGYHLACRADYEPTVAALRARKHREDKPFALMVADVEAAGRVVKLGPGAASLLGSPARPIVLAPRVDGAAVAESVAPGSRELGVMLPYSPLHHLLLHDADAGPLVMTSGNISDEPISFDDHEAISRLGSIAELFLVHDRPIETRTDDSVARVVSLAGVPDRRRVAFVRRSRGYVPGSIPLPGDGASRPLLACGAELKNTFCLARGRRSWVSHHIGDLSNVETLRSFTTGIDHFQRLFSVAPEVVAHDLHPDYLSTRYALERDDVELLGVQHHHAHLAACLAEHDEPGPAVGAIFDGTGYGLDGTVWGGEILFGDLGSFRRVGALREVRMPGGERAIRQPWRMACAWLIEAGADAATGAPTDGAGDAPALPASLAGHVPADAWRQVGRLASSGLASPVTTSAGRLFDAVAALAGVRAEINYEGQAAIELEAEIDPLERGTYPLPVLRDGELDRLVLDAAPLILAVADDVAGGASLGRIAARFHNALAAATVAACVRAATDCATDLVVLSGGVFLNRRLLEAVAGGVAAAGLRVLTPSRLPAGDGGISYGQAAIAARLTAR